MVGSHRIASARTSKRRSSRWSHRASRDRRHRERLAAIQARPARAGRVPWTELLCRMFATDMLVRPTRTSQSARWERASAHLHWQPIGSLQENVFETVIRNPLVRFDPTGVHSPSISTALHEPEGHCCCMLAAIALRAATVAAPQPLAWPVLVTVKRWVPQVHTGAGGGQNVRTPSHSTQPLLSGPESQVPEAELHWMTEPSAQSFVTLHVSADSICPSDSAPLELHAVNIAVTTRNVLYPSVGSFMCNDSHYFELAFHR